MLGKASLFIRWLGGQLPLQRTISFHAQWQSGGFTEAIPAGKPNPAPPEATKPPQAQAFVIEVSQALLIKKRDQPRRLGANEPPWPGYKVEL